MVRRRDGRLARRFTMLPVVVGILASLVAAAPVAAIDPAPGDEIGTAIPIPEIGVPQDYDTSGATTNEADPVSCDGESGHFDGPFTETFWHTFTPVASGDLIVDVNSFPDPEGPGFLAILFVFVDDGAGGTTLVACKRIRGDRPRLRRGRANVLRDDRDAVRARPVTWRPGGHHGPRAVPASSRGR